MALFNANLAQNALNIIATQTATRIVVILRRGCVHRTKPSSEIIAIVLQALCTNVEEYLLLVEEYWDRHDVLVFDLFHTDYSWENGHIKSELPVVCVDFSRTSQRISIASPMLREEVNKEVASHHNLNGWDAHPPYTADHTLGRYPSYANPRSTCRSDNDSSCRSACNKQDLP